MPHRFALRDAALLAITLGLWIADASLRESGAALATASAWAAGLGAGLCAFLLHEWGHWLGARAGGSVVLPPRTLLSPFLFSYDSRANSRRQFLLMSFAGFLATGMFLAGFWLLLPEGTLARRVGLGAALTLATLTVIFEFPLAWRVWRGGGLPPVELFPRHRRSAGS